MLLWTWEGKPDCAAVRVIVSSPNSSSSVRAVKPAGKAPPLVSAPITPRLRMSGIVSTPFDTIEGTLAARLFNSGC